MAADEYPKRRRRSVDFYGGSLLISAFVCVSRGLAYTPSKLRPETPPPGFAQLAELGVPILIFGVAWFVGAAACVFMAVSKQNSVWPFLAAVFMPLIWGFSYVGATLFTGSSGWLTGVFYLALMGYIVSAGLPRVRRV